MNVRDHCLQHLVVELFVCFHRHLSPLLASGEITFGRCSVGCFALGGNFTLGCIEILFLAEVCNRIIGIRCSGS